MDKLTVNSRSEKMYLNARLHTNVTLRSRGDKVSAGVLWNVWNHCNAITTKRLLFKYLNILKTELPWSAARPFCVIALLKSLPGCVQYDGKNTYHLIKYLMIKNSDKYVCFQ